MRVIGVGWGYVRGWNMGSRFTMRYFWRKGDISNVLKLIENTNKPLAHICSGRSNIGDVRLDLSYICMPKNGKYPVKYQGSCNIIGDMLNIPLKSSYFNTVLCDPIYDYNFTDNTLINELVRILKPSGFLIFIAPWISKHPKLKLIHHEPWTVGAKPPYYKIACKYVKIQTDLNQF